MDPRKLFSDARLAGLCAYCGGVPGTRDHVPSKVLLDRPYPEDLPVVDSCLSCNVAASAAEQYLACLVECSKYGSEVPDSRYRSVVAATLVSRPGIGVRIKRCQDSRGSYQPDHDLVRRVLLKLARGHISYELGLQHPEEPALLQYRPALLLDEVERQAFFTIEHSGLYPEIGSRAFVALDSGSASGFERWNVVQAERYAYAVGQAQGDWVKLLIGDYLACEVAWY